MKQLLAMLCAALMLTAVMSGCMAETEKKGKEIASEAVSGAKKAATEMGFDDNATRNMTEATSAAEDDETQGMIEGAVDSMIENGEVEDGDGNIGELENRDGDANVDENAQDQAPENE